MEEVKPIAVSVKAVEEVSARPKENLKQRAYLNTVSSMIDYACAQVIGFIVSPFIVGGLGSSMYGVWKMVSQMTGYATFADSRATQVLKWTVAKKKDVVSAEELRSDISSAFFVVAFILPLILVVGGAISWYAPYITNADPRYFNIIRITCSLLVLSLAISRVFDLFESVLRGMNLGYKRMGFRGAILLCGGGLKVLFLSLGYGLIGLSLVQVFVSIITGLTFYFIVRKNVPWFGFGKTNLKKVWSFGKLSGWNMANTTTDTLLNNTDKVLLGFIAGPMLVSSYALTLFLPLAIQGLIARIIIGVMPGMGKLLGLKDYSKILNVRRTINDLILLLTTGAGVVVILFNQSFLKWWVGVDHYSGDLVNILIIIMVLQDIFIKHDGYFITATLDLKRKVFLTCMAATVFIALGFLLVREFEVVGLCVSIIAAKLLLFIGQRRFIHNLIQARSPVNLYYLRSIGLSFFILAIAGYFSGLVNVVPLVHMIWMCPVTFVASVALFYIMGLQRERREGIAHAISSLKFFKSN